MTTGCGLGESSGDTENETAEAQDPVQEALSECSESGQEDALAQDAGMYAEAVGLSREEGIRRMRLQECYSTELGRLERSLRENEAESFAGLWIEHEPEYRVVVSFKDDAGRRVEPYIGGKPYEPLVVARSGAEASLDELDAAQRESSRLLDRLGIAVNSGQNIQKSRVELELPNPERLEATLSERDERLPEHVVVIRGALARPSVD